MSKPDTPVLKITDIPTAVGLLTRLPVRADTTRMSASAWAFPMVGVIVGTLAAIIGLLLMKTGLSAGLCAAVVLAVMIIITGAMHEDGLADTVDGLWGGWDKERRLEIMKDSHIGTYGVLALLLSVILRWTAIAGLISTGGLLVGVIIAATLSRAPMVVLMAVIPHARDGGLSASVGRVTQTPAAIAVGFAVLTAVVFCGWSGLLSVAAVALSGLICALIAQRKIGGQTGDILGATQQISEIVVLLTMAVIWV